MILSHHITNLWKQHQRTCAKEYHLYQIIWALIDINVQIYLFLVSENDIPEFARIEHIEYKHFHLTCC